MSNPVLPFIYFHTDDGTDCCVNIVDAQGDYWSASVTSEIDVDELAFVPFLIGPSPR